MSTRIALFADVHANLPALQAVIQDAQSRAVNESWNLGDMVGYAPFPNQVVALLAKQCSRHVLGNHDIKCADNSHADKMRSAGKDPDKVYSFAWTNQALNSVSREFIARLPRTELLDVAGWSLLLTHGSPGGINDGITPRTAVEKLQSLAAEVRPQGVKVVLCGHTHEFFDRTVDGVRFINPGGVGRSFDGDTRASYCVLDISPERLAVEHWRVPYSGDSVMDEMRARDFSPRLIRSFLQARSLEGQDGLNKAEAEKCLAAAGALSRKFPQGDHELQVARLAGELFSGLKNLHRLGWREEVYLRVAAVLHDTGWVNGREGHHKASRDIILQDRTLPLNAAERAMVALAARYHRGSLPDSKHKVYADLAFYDQENVGVLAACLRIADGLDRTHRALVAGVDLAVGLHKIDCIVRVNKGADIAAELSAAKVKSDLLERIFGLPVEFCSAVV
ncbi:MAG: metallophosphoesterase family protein [Candidatus Omnitrophica bacterium]|nr:metallophosphoesterase family protein [Candidatus Omnitrophota bacterium]